jgi:hypothetical protein
LLELLDCLGNIELTDAQDERSFRFGPSKKFSVKGCYYTLNYGGVLRQGNLEIWNSWAPKKCKIFAWLACWRRPPELEAQCRSAMSLSLTHSRTTSHMTSWAQREYFATANATAPDTLTFISLVFTTECDPISQPCPLTLRLARLWHGNVVHVWCGENAAGPHRERSTVLALHQVFVPHATS